MYKRQEVITPGIITVETTIRETVIAEIIIGEIIMVNAIVIVTGATKEEVIGEIMNIGPVSYTHLDVYKRQGKNIVFKIKKCFKFTDFHLTKELKILCLMTAVAEIQNVDTKKNFVF